MSLTPDLGTVIAGAIKAALKGVRVALPARVETYDASTQQVTVQPLVFEGFNDETGKRQTERLPVIAGVPLVFPSAGGYRLTFPVAAGDTVLLVFSSSSIDRWLALGGEVDPIDDRRHNISDAIAIPGLRDFSHPLASAPTNCVSLGFDKGPTIEVDPNQVRLGGPDASLAVVVQSALDDFNTTLTNVINATSPSGATPQPPTNAAFTVLQTFLKQLNLGKGWLANTSVTKAK